MSSISTSLFPDTWMESTNGRMLNKEKEAEIEMANSRRIGGNCAVASRFNRPSRNWFSRGPKTLKSPHSGVGGYCVVGVVGRMRFDVLGSVVVGYH